MPGYDNLLNVRSLSQTQISKLTNAQLKEALATIVNADREEPTNAALLEELRNVREEISSLKYLKDEVKQVTSRLDDAFKIINLQQKFLENLDSRERSKNFIVFGLQEEANALGDDDLSKVKSIVKAAKLPNDLDVSTWQLRRLGQRNGGNKRPLWIGTDRQQVRNLVLDHAKNLKDVGDIYSAIYMKKDLHPAVRKETLRLREREKEEKNKPENVGVNIRYDWKNKVLLRDNEIIDKYAPSFFYANM